MIGKVMSEDMFNHISNNIHLLKEINVEEGTILTVRNSTGCLDGGYLRVKIKGRVVLVHQIIAVKLFGNKCIGMQINHKDGNKLNNKINNLELTSLKENIRHAFKIGLYENAVKKRRKLLDKDVIEIRKSDKSVRYLSNKFNVSKDTILSVKKNKTYKEIC